MSPNKGLERYLLLYFPWLISLIFKYDPLLSYLIAWLGSFFIFYITLNGWVKPIPNDRNFSEQLMRPLFILQIIFAGYMSCTSIFYLFNTLGYENFHKSSFQYLSNKDVLILIAQCQRYYSLGHAAFVTGILIFMKYPATKTYFVNKGVIAGLLLRVAIISLPVAVIFTKVPGLSQFSEQFNSLSFIAGTLALAFAIPQKKSVNILICSALYLFNFYEFLISGFKEPIIVSIMVLGIFLYPNYKKIVTITFIPLLLFAFWILPAYVNTFRQNAWSGQVDVDESAQIAIDATINDDQQETNWDFLVYRLSEIDMFTKFIQSTPSRIDYYGTDLLKQSLIVIIPRIFWPHKPITEKLVMQRVYDAGVISRYSRVSAKPAFIVDAYLSGGQIGIFISLFLYGAIAQLISIRAERLFGGYILGSALIFSGLFQIFWRGLSFEFIINSVFWSYISMYIIFHLFRYYKILNKV
ncbi:exosortase Y-associated Wzy-like protein [Mucilaginibacter segetis]|uniref:Oligosaccharide repeat unit polymerase n=1 Tax=Mucilaginibacter segetis TaxID=2793071 RepID=A0A934ULC5_9SPHI|nr:hypothetical protein [Mucilaginibacter segetis]MBK0378189.1 hypothetical protein [Mucilaginibacter segetis]